MKRWLAVTAVAAAVLLPTSNAHALLPPPKDGWSPLDPPSVPGLFALQFQHILYSVTCNGVTATGWSADGADDTASTWDTTIVTTTPVATACFESPGSILARQGDDTLAIEPYNYWGIVRGQGDQAYIDWDFVPMPRVGQWVGIGARSADGAPLPLLERRIVTVGADTFTVDQPIDAAYLGAPVVDNMGRALGMVTTAGIEVTGSPQFCVHLFECADPGKVWWDITAPSAVTNAKAVGGKRKVTVTWQPVASEGGDEVAYWYRVGQGEWKFNDTFRVVLRAAPKTRVTVTIVAINHAGPGPSKTVWAIAK